MHDSLLNILHVIYLVILSSFLYAFVNYFNSLASNKDKPSIIPRKALITKNDEIRLIWKIAILILFSVVLSGGIEVILSIIIFGDASRSSLFFLADYKTLSWEAIASNFIAALSLFIAVWFVVVKLEKRLFSLKKIGLNWGKNSIWQITLGIILGVFFVIIPFFIFLTAKAFFTVGVINTEIMGIVLNRFQVTLPLNIDTVKIFLTFIPMAFAEEAVFRAYLQVRMIDLFGAFRGVIITAILFVLLHCPGIASGFQIFNIFIGIFVWCFAGYLYYRYKSLFLLGTIHATFNIVLFIWGNIGVG